MSDIRVASRYAKSLLDLAVEKNELDSVYTDMKNFRSLTRSNREFTRLLKNPIVRNDKKMKILDAIFAGKVNPMTYSFMQIISRKNRESVLPEIADAFFTQYNTYKGISKAEVTTTFPLNDDMRKQITDLVVKMTGNQVELVEKIDKSLIGGYVLRVGDRQIDESISSKLSELKAEFSKNPYVREI
jgi:F-type H+-transporting ATPase subunit delta